jgi:hypothetical protein
MPEGLEAHKQVIATFHGVFAGLSVTVEDEIAENSTRLPLAGTPKNSPWWVPRKVHRLATLSPSAISVHRIAAGKFAKGWVDFDALVRCSIWVSSASRGRLKGLRASTPIRRRNPGSYRPRPFLFFLPLFTNCVEEEFSEVHIRDPAYLVAIVATWRRIPPPEYLTLNPTCCGAA